MGISTPVVKDNLGRAHNAHHYQHPTDGRHHPTNVSHHLFPNPTCPSPALNGQYNLQAERDDNGKQYI